MHYNFFVKPTTMPKQLLHGSIACLLLFVALLASGQGNTTLPFQNAHLPIQERVDDLISRMTLEEKVNQLFNAAPAVPRLGIPEYNWWNEGLHGVARAGKATVFPQAIGLAATFDEPLMFKVASTVSDEARAKHHDFVRNHARGIYMGLTIWTPNINIFRDPRWGRGQETYGEDPYLTGRMAVNFIKGLQGNDQKYFKTIATAKHYAVHSGPEFSRHIDNNVVNDRDLYETYLPAFKASVKEANVQSVMCAYNRFRDQPCCGSDVLLSNILRQEFGFSGYIVSDCGAITDFYKKGNHNIVDTPAQAFGWSLSAGTDLNCEESKPFVANIAEAVEKGYISEKDINVSLGRVLKARFQLGMFDPDMKHPYTQIPISVVGSKPHLDLSLQAAEKSLVLLKNNGILPLKKGKKVALIGPNANNFSILIGNYNGDPINPITPLKGLQERLGASNVLYTPGCPIVPGVFTDYELVRDEFLFHERNGKLEKGLKAAYYQDKDWKGSPAIERIDGKIDFSWPRSPINKVVDESFAVRWTGVLVPKKSGSYLFGGNVTVKINGNKFSGQPLPMQKGKRYNLEAELVVSEFWWSSNHQQQFASLTWVDASRDYKQEALDASKKADVIVFCGGISANLEGEEMPLETEGFAHGDRTNIDLPKIQEDLLKDLQKTGKPIVYVNFSGSAIALNWQQENLPAIVQAFYPGETTGKALANLLYGDFSPAGRLPVTFYKSVTDLPPFLDYRMEGKTYRYFKGNVLYPFGYGLSYTKFEYKNLQMRSSIATGASLKISVDVTNTGNFDGEEVVQLFQTNTSPAFPTAIRSLAGFKRVFIKKGETKNVEFELTPDQLAILNSSFKRVMVSGSFQISVGGGQPLPNIPHVQGNVTVAGADFLVE
jgi:beta-glucosidase